MTTTKQPTFTTADLDALGVSTDIRTAAKAMGIGTSHAYKLANNDQFPIPIHRVGGRWVVPTSSLRAFLEVPEVTG